MTQHLTLFGLYSRAPVPQCDLPLLPVAERPAGVGEIALTVAAETPLLSSGLLRLDLNFASLGMIKATHECPKLGLTC